VKNGEGISSPTSIKEIFWNLKDWEYDLEITKIRLKRSNDQNRYFHWVVLPMLAEHMWYIVPGIENTEWLQEAKEAIISAFIPSKKYKNPIDKRKRVVIQKRTSDLDTIEFKQFIDTILIKFPFIPSPNSGDLDNLINHYSNIYAI
jgi:flavin-dependent dehydrogenase